MKGSDRCFQGTPYQNEISKNKLAKLYGISIVRTWQKVDLQFSDTNIEIDLKEHSISVLPLLVVNTFRLLKFPSKPLYLLRFSFVTLIELCFRSSDLFLNKIHP